MELTTQQKQEVLKLLCNADGEDVETIISESGFDKYLTRAFIIQASDYDLHYYLSERKEIKTQSKKQSHTELKSKSLPDTYFEVVRYITAFTNRDEYDPEQRRNPIEIAQDDEGWSKLYDIAIKWSEEFDKLNKNRKWNGEFVDAVEEFCNKKNVNNQEDLMDEIRAKADINIVGCGHCGGFLLHRRSDYKINCPHCDTLMDVCDCPDLIY